MVRKCIHCGIEKMVSVSNPVIPWVCNKCKIEKDAGKFKKNKPSCQLVGQDGNVFNLIGGNGRRRNKHQPAFRHIDQKA